MMKRWITFFALLCSGVALMAQVQLDNRLELVGSGSNAKVTGIEEVLNNDDATNKIYVDTAIANRAASGNGVEVMDEATRDALPSPTDGLVIYNTDQECINYYQSGFWYTLCGTCTPEPSVAAAGPDQLDILGTSAVMAANTPTAGSGSWSIVSGSGGSFSSNTDPGATFNGTANTAYVLRWTISNGCGSTDDEVEVSFLPSFVCGLSTITDIDGNAYNTVEIGSQCWMKENLKTTRDASGNSITRYCYNNSASACNTYGGLYTWNTVMNGASSSTTNPSGVIGICPSGWHVPSDAEWCELENTAQAGLDAGCSNTGWRGSTGGDKLKASGSNTTGFTSLFSGARNTSGNYEDQGTNGFYWTASAGASTSPRRLLASFNDGVNRFYLDKAWGFSLRCVRD